MLEKVQSDTLEIVILGHLLINTQFVNTNNKNTIPNYFNKNRIWCIIFILHL